MKRRVLTGQDFAVGVLGVTAVILLTSLFILQSLAPRTAMASGQGGVVGDYVVSTSRLDNLTEVLFIADTTAEQMNMYAFIPERGLIELVQQFDLRALQVPQVVPGAQGGDLGRGRGGRRNR